MNASLKNSQSLLEQAFFHEKQATQLATLRDQTAVQERKQALRSASGLKDDAVLERLAALEISPATLSAVSLVPLVEVAWADDTMADKERAAVLEAAASEGITPGAPAYELLSTWLAIRPGAGLRQAWGGYVRALCGELTSEQSHALRDQLIGRARGVASAAGGLLGIASISRKEEAVLLELEAVFEG